MPNTYTWVIDTLECMPSYEGQTNVISNVHWRINATSDITKQITKENYNLNTVDGVTEIKSDTTVVEIPYMVTTYGVQKLTYISGNSFTNYENLNLETVINWVKSAMGTDKVTEIQTQLDNMLINLINPTTITPNFPWNS